MSLTAAGPHLERERSDDATMIPRAEYSYPLNGVPNSVVFPSPPVSSSIISSTRTGAGRLPPQV